MKVVVAEKISPSALDLLREARWTVVTPEQLDGKLAGQLESADALIVRSAVDVTAELLANARKLRVIGRAGVGVDNIDLDAATRQGIAVMNTPGANAIAVAEHTLAMMLAMARPIGRAIANIIAKVCSATAIAFAPGVFMTAMPCRVAASRSMLSTPTPARPITRSLRALASNSAVTSTAERTMSASADSSCPANLPSNCSGVTTVQRASRSKSSADGEIFSATTTFMMNYRAP